MDPQSTLIAALLASKELLDSISFNPHMLWKHMALNTSNGTFGFCQGLIVDAACNLSKAVDTSSYQHEVSFIIITGLITRLWAHKMSMLLDYGLNIRYKHTTTPRFADVHNFDVACPRYLRDLAACVSSLQMNVLNICNT